MSKPLVIAFALFTAVGCSSKGGGGGDGWPAKARAMADEVCQCKDRACADAAHDRFVKEISAATAADRANVSNDDGPAIGEAEMKAAACTDKVKGK